MSHTTRPIHCSGTFYTGFLEKRRGADPVYGTDDQSVIESTVQRLLSSPTTAKHPGILLGKIQSGKTKTFLAVTALSFDNGYDIAVILTKPTTALAKQTDKRVSRDFADFIEADQAKAYDILEIPERLTQFELNQKLILIVKKQKQNLERLAEALLHTYPQLARKRILIIDDEADNASIGFYYKNGDLELRTIAGQVDELRQQLPAASFLQVTATPYSLYLQPEDSPPGLQIAPVRPKFTELVPVHPDYVGGHFYFEESRQPQSPAHYIFHPVKAEELDVLRQPDGRRLKLEDCLVSPRIEGLRAALVTFVTAACLRRIQDETENRRPKRFAFLFHTEAAKAAHAWQEEVILAFDEHLRHEAETTSATLRDLVQAAYTDLERSILAGGQPLPAFATVWARVCSALTSGEIMITKVNSEAQVASLLDDDGQLRLRTPLNIFIGGQILDRGITIANLIGFYYGRNPQRFQQDTVLQHSRMYGFRPPADRCVTRFYTAPHIHAAMRRMHDADTALRDRIEDQAQNPDRTVTFIELDENNTIVPCSPTKILASNITTLRPHRRVVPSGFETDVKTRLRSLTQQLDAHLAGLVGPLPVPGENPAAIDISTDEACDLLARIDPAFVNFAPGYEDTWNLLEHQAILRHLSDSTANPANRGRVLLMLRTGRKVSRKPSEGAHAEFNEPDTTRTDGTPARAAATDLPLLMLIRQEGSAAQGWSDAPFWWPVIYTPENMRPTLFAHAK
ncbi:MAG: Z1 domain-containing protein [Opitutaceae bacterium]|jgi:hypothetical protein